MNKCLSFICLRQTTHLDKSKKKLDQIPKDIVRYEKSLVELDIQHNNINVLDKNLFRCRKLERLYLNDNAIVEIPDEIGELTSLQELYLSRNGIQEFSDRIQNCERLLYLDISSNQLQRLPDGVTGLRNLQVLIMNEISANVLPSTVSSLCNLRVLEARDNLIPSVPESISFLSKLTRLDLGCNEISTLPETIGQLQCLVELWLDTNILNQLPAEIGELRNLEILELSNNPISHLTDQICNLENLTDLTLTSNPLTELPENFGYLKSLRILKVDYNQLKHLPDSIRELTNLAELYLSGNSLTALPKDFGDLKNLRTLHVDYNSIKVLPDSICMCEELTIFSIRDNLLESLPEDLGDLSKLGVLDVSGNRLKYLPFSIHKLKKMKALWLSKTQQKSMYPLQIEESVPNGKVLTNFLLPQLEDVDKIQSGNLSMTSFDIPQKPEININDANSNQKPTETQVQQSNVKSSTSKSIECFQMVETPSEVKLEKPKEMTTNTQNCQKDEGKGDMDCLIQDDTYIQDFSIHNIRIPCGKESHGIVINLASSNHEPIFGYDESRIFIIDIIEGSPAFNLKLIHVGDRILSINQIPLHMVTPAEAASLLDIHKENLELSIRHEPDPSTIKLVKLCKSTPDQKLGLKVKLNYSKASPKIDSKQVPLLELLEILPNSLADEDKRITIGSFIIDINSHSMLRAGSTDFTAAVDQSDEEISLILYDPRWK